MHYVYRHIRLDKNEIFYIGIGKNSPNCKSKYKRAFSKRDRNRIWKAITRKTQFKVEIILENESRDFVEQAETELIKSYGKICDKAGPLANIKDGKWEGEKFHYSKSDLKRMKENSYLRGKYGKDHPASESIYVYTLEGKFYQKYDSQTIAENELGLYRSCISESFRNNTFTTYFFSKNFLGDTIPPIQPKRHKSYKPIYLRSKTGQIYSFDSIEDCRKHFNLSRGIIRSLVSQNKEINECEFSFTAFD